MNTGLWPVCRYYLLNLFQVACESGGGDEKKQKGTSPCTYLCLVVVVMRWLVKVDSGYSYSYVVRQSISSSFTDKNGYLL